MEPAGPVEVFRVLLWWMLVQDPALAQVKNSIPVLWMMPVGSRSGRENQTAGVTPAVRLALEDLQRQPAPLGNYEIQLELLDSQCDPAQSLKALFDAMWAGPTYLLVFGAVCPPVTELIARALPALNLVQVSFAASSPGLANKKWYGNLFSTAPSDRAVNHATVKLLQRFRWSRVGLVSQGGARFSEMKKDLVRQLLKADVQVAAEEILFGDACSSLRRLKETDVRIIIAQFDEDSVSDVFCCVYQLNLFGPRYQWIIADGGTSEWRLGWQVSGCRTNSLLMAADGSIRLQIQQLSNVNTPGVSGRTPQDYQNSYLRLLIQEGSKFFPLHGFAYDAVWVAVRAVSQVMEAARHREKYSVQRNTSLSQVELHRMLLEALKKTTFKGVTGPVWFRNGERMMSIKLIQFQGSGGVSVGEFMTSTQQLRVMTPLLRFKGPGPARDRALILLQQQQINFLLYMLVSSSAAGTVIITLTVLLAIITWNCWYHCRSSESRAWLLFLAIKSGSGLSGSRWDSQDLLLLLGLLLTSSSVLISGLDSASISSWTFELLCSVRLWMLSVGHTLGSCVLIAKTWRVYSFNVAKQKGPGWVLPLTLLLDVFVLTSWQILDPLKRAVLQRIVESASADQDKEVRLSSEHCSSNMELWLTVVYGYKGPLLGLGCFLAWSVRASNQHHHLTQSMFAVTAFSISGATTSLLTSHNPPVHFGVTSILILTCNMLVLIRLFGPQCLNGGEPHCDDAGEEEEEEEEEEPSRLNQRLKSWTAQLDVEIETISLQLWGTSVADQKLVLTTIDTNNGDLTRVTHRTPVCSEDRTPQGNQPSPEILNSPEHVWRRFSVQLPILHHSYLPAVGGVSASSSIQSYLYS